MNRLAAALALALAAPAAAAPISREELKAALEANPDLVLQALKKADKAALFGAVMDAQGAYREKMQREQEEQERKEIDARIKNPLKPAIDEATRVRGDRGAPLTLVEYSDFQCPFCSRGFKNVEALRKKYGAKLRFVFKHMPIPSIHPQAMPAARWMEAVSLQSPDKAWIFHDKMFENQDKLGEEFFRATAKELGVDVEKAAKDAGGDAVKARIEADIAEANKFEFSGTPGYLLNGIPVRGAFPVDYFDMLIKKIEAK